jgi:hypothetical protein
MHYAKGAPVRAGGGATGAATTQDLNDKREHLTAPTFENQISAGPANDLFDEFVVTVASASRRDFDQLVSCGVLKDFLSFGPAKFGVSAIIAGRDGFYQPTDSGEAAIIMPALPLAAPWEPDFPSDDPGDLVAFHLGQPDRWWWRVGSVPILNPMAITRAEILHEPLILHSCPLNWLRAGGIGSVVLDRSKANLGLYLGGISQIIADTVKLGDEIERRLRSPVPALPRVFIQQPTRRLAA